MACEKCGITKLAPAPAPECDHGAAFGVFVGGKLLCRVCDKPAPETAKCDYISTVENPGAQCHFQQGHLGPHYVGKHGATAKAVVGKESKMGLEATAPLEAPTQPPAAENAPPCYCGQPAGSPREFYGKWAGQTGSVRHICFCECHPENVAPPAPGGREE